MSKWKYAIGDQFIEGSKVIQIVGLGNSKGVYYCRTKFKYSDPVRLDMYLERFEYRTEEELNKLEVVL